MQAGKTQPYFWSPSPRSAKTARLNETAGKVRIFSLSGVYFFNHVKYLLTYDDRESQHPLLMFTLKKHPTPNLSSSPNYT
jgi:hypothetical protein